MPALRHQLLAIGFACAIAVLASARPSAGNHGAAGDPNLSIESMAVVGEAQRGACSTLEVRIKNTSAQVSVTSPWRVLLETIGADGAPVAEQHVDHHGLGHKWETKGGGLPDEMAVAFENVTLPATGENELRASVTLLTPKQKEFSLEDNTRTITVRVAAECAPAATESPAGP